MTPGSVTSVQLSCAPKLPVASSDIFPILSLPKDILRHLLGTEQYLDNESRMVCRFVCRRFKNLTNVTYDDYSQGTFCNNAARKGDLKLLEWGHGKGASIKYAISAAASGGHLRVLNWLLIYGCKHHYRSIHICGSGFAAAKAGHLHVLQRLDQFGWFTWLDPFIWSGESLHSICETASANGHLKILQWANSRRPNRFAGPSLAFFAAYYGHRHILEWIRDNGKLDANTCMRAAAGGQFETLQWAHSIGVEWNVMVCAYAARNGDLKMLQWARDHHAPWDERVCTYAAETGHIDVLQWARENGAPWDSRTCTRAFAMGYLSTFEWAREHGAPVDEASLSYQRPMPQTAPAPRPHILCKIKP